MDGVLMRYLDRSVVGLRRHIGFKNSAFQCGVFESTLALQANKAPVYLII